MLETKWSREGIKVKVERKGRRERKHYGFCSLCEICDKNAGDARGHDPRDREEGKENIVPSAACSQIVTVCLTNAADAEGFSSLRLKYDWVKKKALRTLLKTSISLYIKWQARMYCVSRQEHRGGVQTAHFLGGGVQLSPSTAQRCLLHKNVIFLKMRKFSGVHL